jgi:hypothetical protein
LVATCCAKKSPGGISASARGLPPLPSPSASVTEASAEPAAALLVLLSWFHSKRKMRAVERKRTMIGDEEERKQRGGTMKE